MKMNEHGNPGLVDSYLDLMEKLLTASFFDDGFFSIPLKVLPIEISEVLKAKNIYLVQRSTPELREGGRDIPLDAITMVGRKRLRNLRSCIEDILRNDVPGDLLEAGVWRGGASIYMKAVLHACGVTDRTVWAADSFQGLPKPNAEKYPLDAETAYWQDIELAVSLEEVKKNFAKYNMLDDNVKFLKGWFSESIPGAPIEKLALLRLDGDMYESTITVFEDLYPKLSPGGYVIVDDYNAVAGSQQATKDYRAKNGITENLIDIDGVGAYWQKRKS